MNQYYKPVLYPASKLSCEMFTVKTNSVFLTHIISRRQENADAKVAQLISPWQKWNLHRQFTSIQNLPDHTNRFLRWLEWLI